MFYSVINLFFTRATTILAIFVGVGICQSALAQTSVKAKERLDDVAGAKQLLFGFGLVDDADRHNQPMPFTGCDPLMLIVAKADDKINPANPEMKRAIIDFCSVQLGAYRANSKVKLDYFVKKDLIKANHDSLISMFSEYNDAKTFWSYANSSIKNYDPVKKAFPVWISSTCSGIEQVQMDEAKPPIMVQLCVQFNTINAQMGSEEDARALSQKLVSGGFGSTSSHVYWIPKSITQTKQVTLNLWTVQASVVGFETFENNGTKRGVRVMALGNVPTDN